MRRTRKFAPPESLMAGCPMDVTGRWLGWWLACLAVAACPTMAADPGELVERQRQLLEEVGVAGTAEGAIRFLRDLRPGDDIEAQVAQWVKQLGHQSFFVRNKASRSLLQLGRHCEPQLVRAANGFDVEVRFQARRLLQSIREGIDQGRIDARIGAALGILSREKHPDSATTIVDTIPVLETRHHLNRASEALWFAVTRKDMHLIRAAMRDPNVALRIAAIPAFELIADEESIKEIDPFLADEASGIRLAAARALIDRDPDRCLAVLKELLDAEDRVVKLQAAWLISRVLGESELENRDVHFKHQVEKWKEQLGDFDLADLSLPLQDRRLMIKEYQSTFREEFTRDQVSIGKRYHELTYETTVAGAKASVSQGIARLHGDHNEGDQRLFVTAQQIVGNPVFSNSFQLAVDIGGEGGGTGAYHVGVSIGNLRFLFHPGYNGGGYRVERVDNRKYMIGNQRMPFTPMHGLLHEMQIKVQPQKDKRVRLTVSIANPRKPQEKFLHTLVADPEDIGPLRRVALARSGRSGGAALFGSLTIDTSGIDR